MIRKDQAHKVYPRDTPVIRKGDRGWKSDRENWGGQGMKEDKEFLLGSQRHMSNPWSVQDGKLRAAAARDVDLEALPSVDDHEVGDVVDLVMSNGRDLACFRLVEHVELVPAEHDGATGFEQRRREWKYCYTLKNRAL